MIGDWPAQLYSDMLSSWGQFMSQTQIDVEIYADIICPWCYIGKQRLDAAFAAPQVTPRYIWRCFLRTHQCPKMVWTASLSSWQIWACSQCGLWLDRRRRH